MLAVLAVLARETGLFLLDLCRPWHHYTNPPPKSARIYERKDRP